MDFRLLVVKPSSLGDIIHGLQVVAALKKQRPQVSVTWVVRDCFEAAVRCSGVVERTISYGRSGGLRGLWNCCQDIRRAGNFDAVWDMQGLFRSGLMAFAARSPHRIGRRDAREGARLFYNDRILLPPPSAGTSPHAVEILGQFLPTLGLRSSVERLQFRWFGEDCLPAKLFEKPYVLLSPESRGPRKEWPHFDALAADLCARYRNWNFFWVGLEGRPCPRASLRGNFFDLHGETSLPQLLQLVHRSLGVIANDSACTHIAAAIGRPVLAIFVASDPRHSAPYPPNAPGHFTALRPFPGQPFPELEKFLGFIGGEMA
ncbi:MAG: glycosyltransferase family 9 protein [Puniceicoccales bacterium]|jgi:ADP-heptose:LPS heptosyltransferase|nr:glycosyltransferase family 9 protein [Puniceicoccales bacterium]